MRQTGISDIGIQQDLRSQSDAGQEKRLNVGLLILQIFLAFVFLAAGGGKLFDTEPTVEMFKKIGVGQWLRYLTGTIEVFGAVTLWNPRCGGSGALLLAATMVGAIFTHLFIIGGSPVAPVVLLVLLCVIVWGRKDQIKQNFSF